jgi:allophanate hydrolase subunit 2
VILGPDHPVTGGYPVVGVIEDIDPLAQAGPGTPVRFTLVGW